MGRGEDRKILEIMPAQGWCSVQLDANREEGEPLYDLEPVTAWALTESRYSPSTDRVVEGLSAHLCDNVGYVEERLFYETKSYGHLEYIHAPSLTDLDRVALKVRVENVLREANQTRTTGA